MPELRLISFLPAATEMVCALGLESALVGISHDCDYPPSIRRLPLVSHCTLPVESMTLKEIDRAVAERIGSGGELYKIDGDALARLAPSHILTQSLCSVCAPSENEIGQAVRGLSSPPEVLFFTPHSIEEVFDNMRELGAATGREAQAEALIGAGRERLARVAAQVKMAAVRRRVFFLEWIDPYYGCGHWVPEMIELAGGEEVLGRRGRDSVRIPWAEIAAAAPEIVLVSPCGFGLEQAVEQTQRLLEQPGWSDLPASRAGRIYAVNANAYFARPGPRLVDGVELLAHIIHPELASWSGPDNAFRQVK